MSTTRELSGNQHKMDDTETGNRSSEDADMKQFDKLFSELVAESTADDDPQIADAMKWFKRASTLLCCIENLPEEMDIRTIVETYYFSGYGWRNLNSRYLKFETMLNS